MVNSDRVKRKLPSLLVDGSTNTISKKEHFNVLKLNIQYMLAVTFLSESKGKKPN